MTVLSFTVEGAAPLPFTVVPTLGLRLRLHADAPVDSIVLRCQVRVEPTLRGYGKGEQGRLLDLFGAPERWGETVTSFVWTHLTTTVGGFDGETRVELPIECSYDLEVTAGKYFDALDEGEVPLLLLFSGTVFTRPHGRLQAEQIPWDREARFRLPVTVWRGLMDAHFPGAGWLRLRRETIDALRSHKARHALATWDDTVADLLAALEVGP